MTSTFTTPSSTIPVDDAAVFGPEGKFNPPVNATAVLGTVSLGTVTLTGSSGNLLIVGTSQPVTPSLPGGTVLIASVPASAQTSASSIFPTYVIDSTIQMAIDLVRYFNSLPIKLPPENAPPHTPVQRGAMQTFVYQSIVGTSAATLDQSVAGGSSTSLQELFLAIPLPTTTGSDLEIYKADGGKRHRRVASAAKKWHHAGLQSHAAGKCPAACKPPWRELQFQQRVLFERLL